MLQPTLSHNVFLNDNLLIEMVHLWLKHNRIDYVLVYAKNEAEAKDFKGELDEELVKKLYNKIETD